MLQKLYNWTIEQAKKPYAEKALFGISFVESSFFPIPPDPVLLAMGLSQPKKALWFGLICTIGSVLGGYFGYLLGMFFYDFIGTHIIAFYGYEEKIKSFENLYLEWGALVVFIAGLSPIPYKLATILSGVFALNPVIFGISSLLARGIRFMTLSLIMMYAGDKLRHIIEKNMNFMFVIFTILLVGGFIAIKFMI